MKRTRYFAMASMALGLVFGPAALSTAEAGAHSRQSPGGRQALSVHRAQSAWHLARMHDSDVRFTRWGQSVNRLPGGRFFTGPALGGMRASHSGMGTADTTFLSWHERRAAGR